MQSLLIYEDNSRLRELLQMLLNDEVNFKVKASFDNCNQVIADMLQYEPDMVIMDIDMPGMSGIEGVKFIKQTKPETRVVMYTVFEDDERIYQSICNGADGYLLKNTTPIKLLQALNDLNEGNTPMSPFVAQRVFNYFRLQQVKPNYQLTRREQEILQLLVLGNSYKMIAGQCFISIDTVKRHLQNIYAKLHVSCGTEAVAKALKERIVAN